MANKLHFIFGLALAGLYVYGFLNIAKYFPNLVLVMDSHVSSASNRGAVIILVFPLIPIICFLSPGWLTNMFSPRSKKWGTPLLTDGFWYIAGYFFLAVTVSLLALFIA